MFLPMRVTVFWRELAKGFTLYQVTNTFGITIGMLVKIKVCS